MIRYTSAGSHSPAKAPTWLFVALCAMLTGCGLPNRPDPAGSYQHFKSGGNTIGLRLVSEKSSFLVWKVLLVRCGGPVELDRGIAFFAMTGERDYRVFYSSRTGVTVDISDYLKSKCLMYIEIRRIEKRDGMLNVRYLQSGGANVEVQFSEAELMAESERVVGLGFEASESGVRYYKASNDSGSPL